MADCNNSIRKTFKEMLDAENFQTDKTGVKCLEIINASFIVTEPTLFGQVNEYADRELAWYKSLSLFVDDIPAPVPEIWKAVSDSNGMINSNYGWCIWSAENNLQYYNCLKTLKSDVNSRRACMIYIRPSMQVEYNQNGMSDFMCTFSTQAMIRNNELHYIVYMRSNDAILGFKNDCHWHKMIHADLHRDLLSTYPTLKLGDMHWVAGSLHVYERHFKLVEEFDE